MLVKHSEIRSYTAEEAQEIVRQALNVTGELDPPDDLRVAVFQKAADMLSQKHIQYADSGMVMARPNGQAPGML